MGHLSNCLWFPVWFTQDQFDSDAVVKHNFFFLLFRSLKLFPVDKYPFR